MLLVLIPDLDTASPTRRCDPTAVVGYCSLGHPLVVLLDEARLPCTLQDSDGDAAVVVCHDELTGIGSELNVADEGLVRFDPLLEGDEVFFPCMKQDGLLENQLIAGL